MQTRMDIFKEITLHFTASDYASMKNAVLKYFTIADSFGEIERDDIKQFLYLVYLLTLLKLNEKSEAITSMLFCLKAQKGYLNDLNLKNSIYCILHSMTEENDRDIYSEAQEAHHIHPAYADFFNCLNKLPAEVLLETNIAMASLDHKDLDKNYDDEFISLFNIWLKQGLEQNNTIAHIFYPFKLHQAMTRRITNINMDEFLQQNYYPAIEALAFLIISDRMPTLDCKKHFLIVGGDPFILDYFSTHFNKDFLNKYQIQDAIALLHKIKPINLQLNKVIKMIDYHLNSEVGKNSAPCKFFYTQHCDKDTLNQKPFRKKINVFIFQPDGRPPAGQVPSTGFYNLSFDEKLCILKEKIITVTEYIKTNSYPEKNIFVAPEFLFKNFTKQASERYYSKDEKNIFKQTLIDLSKDTDLILAPGTICWKNKSTTDDQIYFRNMIYLVHRRKVTKYRKYNTAPSETDFWSDYRGDNGYTVGIEHLYRKGHFYKSDLLSYSSADNNVITVGDLVIGIEICHDNNSEQLKNNLHKNQKVDIHLIVAGGLPEVQLLKKNALITVKVDANHHWEKFPKTISLDNQSAQTNTINTYNNPIKTTGELVKIDEHLECHRFKI